MGLKKISIVLLALLAVPVVVSASGAEAEGGTDFWPRLVNFAIFAAILWYLIADKIKAFFVGRSEGIAAQLSTIQEKLKASKEEKEQAIKKAEEAKESAVSLVETAKKEAKILSEKIAKDLELEIAALKKAHAERQEAEEKKMAREVVNEVLEEMFQGKGVGLKNEDLLSIIKKKVA